MTTIRQNNSDHFLDEGWSFILPRLRLPGASRSLSYLVWANFILKPFRPRVMAINKKLYRGWLEAQTKGKHGRDKTGYNRSTPTEEPSHAEDFYRPRS